MFSIHRILCNNFHFRSSNRTGGPRRETGEREEAKLKDPNSRLGSCRSNATAATRQSMEAALFGFRLQSVILDRYDTVHQHLDFFFPLHLAWWFCALEKQCHQWTVSEQCCTHGVSLVAPCENIELLLLNQLTHLDLVHYQRIMHTCYRCLLLWIPIAQVYWTKWQHSTTLVWSRSTPQRQAWIYFVL